MPLVNYTSDSDSASSPISPSKTPPRKKPRTTSPHLQRPTSELNPEPGPEPGPGPGSNTLPPLPASFHDLYASTVRTTTHDNPALHQGRVRQTPHTPGAWPSHIYIEWHPPSPVHALLTSLITALQDEFAKCIKSSVGGDGTGTGTEGIASFLTSDLGTPQPLHVSLSRPIVLAQNEKDDFLRDVEGVVRGSGIAAGLRLRCGGVEWHRTGESGRSFLVLRVHTRATGGSSSRGEDQKPRDGGGLNQNPELTELLRRCNEVVAKYGQPELYQWAEEEGEREVGGAFHVSIAWSFAKPTEELKRVTEKVFGEQVAKERIEEVEIPVEGVKVKIGNVVTHVALPQPGRRASGKASRNLFGL